MSCHPKPEWMAPLLISSHVLKIVFPPEAIDGFIDVHIYSYAISMLKQHYIVIIVVIVLPGAI